MLIRFLTDGFLDTNCYLVICRKTSSAMIIDSGFKEGEAEKTTIGKEKAKNPFLA